MLSLFVSMAFAVSANDSEYYANGNQLIPLTQTVISVQKEVLTLFLQDDGMTRVEVEYEFFNPREERVILMGFESDAPYPDRPGEIGGHPFIRGFTVEMNGERLPWKCKYIVDTISQPGEAIVSSYVYSFQATFRAGVNRVRHTYSFNNAVGVMMPWSIEYKLTPAARWAGGKIKDFTLRIAAENTMKHFFLLGDQKMVKGTFSSERGAWKTTTFRGADGVNDVREFALRNGAVEWHALDYVPQDELNIESACCVYERPNWQDKDNVIGISYDRAADIVIYPFHYDNLSAWEARVLRNMPYASRGYVFQDKRLQNYFNGLFWYMPDPAYKPSQQDFTEREKVYAKGKFF